MSDIAKEAIDFVKNNCMTWCNFEGCSERQCEKLKSSKMKKTAEEMLKSSIEEHNRQVSQVYAFSFNKHEREMFTALMEEHTDQHTAPLIEALEAFIRSTYEPCSNSDLYALKVQAETALLNAKGL